MSGETQTSALDWLLSQREQAPTYETPWGRGRSLSRREMDAVDDGRRTLTWAELWVIQRDAAEAATNDPIEAAMIATAKTMEMRAATAFRRVACPTCGAEVEKVCRGMPRGWRRDGKGNRGRLLKRSHTERLRADGVELR